MRASNSVRWSLTAAFGVLASACRENPPPPPVVAQPQSAPAHPAIPAASVPPEEIYALSDVRIRYDERNSHLLVSYSVHNRGDKRVRAYLCIDLIDKDGFRIPFGRSFSRVSLGAGTSDQVLDEARLVHSRAWKAAEVLLLHVEESSCSGSPENRRSATWVVDTSGKPLPPGDRPEVKRSETELGTMSGPHFRLDDARLALNDQGEKVVSYRVSNPTRGRVSGQLCIRPVQDRSCSCRGPRGVASVYFELGLAGTEVRREVLSQEAVADWGKFRSFVLYMSDGSCFELPEQGISNVITLAMPASVAAPEKRQ